MIIIGIDASNIRDRGGLVHLHEILKHACHVKNNYSHIVIWGCRSTLDNIVEKDTIIKKHVNILEKGYIARTFWQWLCLGRLVKKEKCTILFVPGGTCLASFKPVVTMSQNLLPFEWNEIKRYRLSFFTLKLLILRVIHVFSFKRANGIIFLTKHAEKSVTSKIKNFTTPTAIISHGIDVRFFSKPREQKNISTYSVDEPFKLVYISPLEPYKHHDNVVEAVSKLRKKGFPVVLDMYGAPIRITTKKRLDFVMHLHDPECIYIKYNGVIDHTEIQEKYYQADISIFASSCETFGQILLESMASGLPTVCSNMSAMHEILGENGSYFNPLEVDSITESLKKTIESVNKREAYAWGGFKVSQSYSWSKCADDTFSFINKVADKYMIDNV